MTAIRTQVKLGLLAIAAVASAALVAIVLHLLARTPTVRYHTYFDESVTGLAIGAPVYYRGVRIGQVGAIAVARDHRRIDVALDLARPAAADLDLAGHSSAFRARLQSSGITGVKYVDVEPAGAEAPPPLAFVPARRYIPARRSFLESLETQSERLAERLPALVDHTTAVVDRLGRMLDELDREHLGARLGAVADRADATIAQLHQLVRHIDRADLPGRAGAAIDQAAAATARARGFLAALEGDGQLDQALRDVASAARAFRELVQEIEREPDMLVKGRARSGRP